MAFDKDIKLALSAKLDQAIATRKRTGSGEDRDVVMLITGVVDALDALVSTKYKERRALK